MSRTASLGVADYTTIRNASRGRGTMPTTSSRSPRFKDLRRIATRYGKLARNYASALAAAAVITFSY